jgi:hypothetical protein
MREVYSVCNVLRVQESCKQKTVIVEAFIVFFFEISGCVLNRNVHPLLRPSLIGSGGLERYPSVFPPGRSVSFSARRGKRD